MEPKLVTSAEEVEAALPYAHNKEFNARWCIAAARKFREGLSAEERTAYRLYGRLGTTLWRESQQEEEAEQNAVKAAADAASQRRAQLEQNHTGPQASLDPAQAPSSTLKQISPSQEVEADAKSRVEDTSNQDADSRGLKSASAPPATSAMLSQSQPKPASSEEKAPVASPQHNADAVSPKIESSNQAAHASAKLDHRADSSSPALWSPRQPGLRWADDEDERTRGAVAPRPTTWAGKAYAVKDLEQTEEDVIWKRQSNGQDLFKPIRKSELKRLNRFAFDTEQSWPTSRDLDDKRHPIFHEPELQAYLEIVNRNQRKCLTMEHALMTYHERLENDSAQLKQFMEDHGIFIQCTRCHQKDIVCDHGWPCTACATHSQDCKYVWAFHGIEDDGKALCKHNVNCYKVHTDVMAFFKLRQQFCDKQADFARSFDGEDHCDYSERPWQRRHIFNGTAGKKVFRSRARSQKHKPNTAAAAAANIKADKPHQPTKASSSISGKSVLTQEDPPVLAVPPSESKGASAQPQPRYNDDDLGLPPRRRFQKLGIS